MARGRNPGEGAVRGALGAAEWAVAAAGAVATVALALRRVRAVDYWWQLAAGRWIVAHGWPRTDPFSAGGDGRPWVELRWIYEAGLALVVDGVGVEAAVILKSVAILGAFALVVKISLGRSTALWTLAVALLAAFASSLRFFLRPEVASFVLLALFLLILERERRGGSRWLPALPLLQVVWTNTHSLFALGPALVGLGWIVSLAEERWPRLAARHPGGRPARLGWTCAAVLAACLLNPYGVRGALWPLRLLTEIHGTAFNDRITEFHGALSYLGLAEVRAFVLLAVLTLLAVAVALVMRRRLDLFWTCVAAAQLYLALIAVRNVPLFCLVAVPTFSVHTALLAAGDRRPRRTPGRLRLAAAAGLVAASSWLVWSLATQRYFVDRGDGSGFGVGLARHRWPERAVEALTGRDLEGTLFNTVALGSYLLERGLPVYVDPRLEVYGEQAFERAVRLAEDPSAWAEEPGAAALRWAVVPIDSPLVRPFTADGSWTPVAFDEAAIVLTRDGEAAVGGLHSTAEFVRAFDAVAVLLGSPRPRSEVPWYGRVSAAEPFRRVARLAVALRRPDQAARFRLLASAAAGESPGRSRSIE